MLFTIRTTYRGAVTSGGYLLVLAMLNAVLTLYVMCNAIVYKTFTRYNGLKAYVRLTSACTQVSCVCLWAGAGEFVEILD